MVLPAQDGQLMSQGEDFEIQSAAAAYLAVKSIRAPPPELDWRAKPCG